jgi:hypothetical protein
MLDRMSGIFGRVGDYGAADDVDLARRPDAGGFIRFELPLAKPREVHCFTARMLSKNRKAAFLRVPGFAHLPLDRRARFGRRRPLNFFAALRVEHALDQVIDGRLFASLPVSDRHYQEKTCPPRSSLACVWP